MTNDEQGIRDERSAVGGQRAKAIVEWGRGKCGAQKENWRRFSSQLLGILSNLAERLAELGRRKVGCDPGYDNAKRIDYRRR